MPMLGMGMGMGMGMSMHARGYGCPLLCAQPRFDPSASSSVSSSLREATQCVRALNVCAPRAPCVADGEAYFRGLYTDGSVATWNLRDQHMVQTCMRLVEHHTSVAYGAPPRVVLWAHNSHVGDASATEVCRGAHQNSQVFSYRQHALGLLVTALACYCPWHTNCYACLGPCALAAACLLAVPLACGVPAHSSPPHGSIDPMPRRR